MESPDGDGELIGAFRDDPGHAGVFCDFDGTLAEIIDAPDEARPVEGAVDVLAALAASYTTVAVISGRPAAFLQDHIDGHGLILAGLYGLERVKEGQVHTAEEVRRWQPVVDEVVARARDGVPTGVVVEAKGLSFALHFRTAPDAADATREWAEDQAADTGLVASPGRRSYELRPPVTTSKGTVLTELSEGLKAACFLGDDHGDLTAFDALDDLAADGVTALRVAVRSPESPDELLDRADLVVDGPTEVVALLRRMLPEPSFRSRFGGPGRV